MPFAYIPDRHFHQPRSKNPRPIACIAAPVTPGNRRPRCPQEITFPWGPVLRSGPPRTPYTALACGVLETAVVEWLGVLAVRLGVRKVLPNGLKTGSGGDCCPDKAFASAERFLFGEGCAYDFEVCCHAVGADPECVRAAVRAAAAALGTGKRPLGGAHRRRTPKVVPRVEAPQEAATALVGASS